MLIYVELLTYSLYNGDRYKFKPHFEKISDDITKEELNKIISNLTKWYNKLKNPNNMYVAIYKDILFDNDHLIWENGKYIKSEVKINE